MTDANLLHANYRFHIRILLECSLHYILNNNNTTFITNLFINQNPKKKMKKISLLLLALICSVATSWAQYTWKGGTTFDADSWAVTDNWDGEPGTGGPGATGSNSWNEINISNVTSGTTPTLEGWNLRMVANASTFTVGGLVKLQNGSGVTSYFTVSNSSNVTVNSPASGNRNNFDVNLGTGTGNTFTFNMTGDYPSTATANFGEASTSANNLIYLQSSEEGTAHTLAGLVIAATVDEIGSTTTATLHSAVIGNISSDITVTSLTASLTPAYTQATGVLTASDENIGKYSLVTDAETGDLTLYWVTGNTLRLEYEALLVKAKAAYNQVKGVSDTKLITSSCTFDNTCGDSSEGTDPTKLCDDDASTFWHSDWHKSCTENPHWIAITFPEAISADDYQLTVVRRSDAADDHVTEFTVYGKNTDDTDWTQISVLSLPYSASGETKTAILNIPTSYNSLKFAATATTKGRTYWHAAELQLQSVIFSRTDVPTEAAALKTQIDAAPSVVSQTDIDNLQNALDAYNEALENLKIYITCNLTDAAGNTFTATAEEAAIKTEPTLTGAYGYELSDQVWSEDGKTLTATITFPFATSSATKQVATTLQSALGSSLWYAKDGNVIADNAANTVVYTSTADNYRWYIYPSLTSDGQFTFKLYNVGAQKYIPASGSVATVSWTATALA